MNSLLTIALFATEQLIRQAPTLFLQFQKIVADKNTTAETLRAKRKAIAAQQFEQLVPNSELPPENQAAEA